MSTNVFKSLASQLLAIFLMAGSLTAPAAAADTGVVYVGSNVGSPNGNSILAFVRDAHGRLTPLPGSPFPTRGKGVFDLSLALGPFDSDQNIVVNPERTLLFAVNPGSNSIAVFHIAAEGGLVHVDGSPFPSGGSNPVSVGLSRVPAQARWHSRRHRDR